MMGIWVKALIIGILLFSIPLAGQDTKTETSTPKPVRPPKRNAVIVPDPKHDLSYMARMDAVKRDANLDEGFKALAREDYEEASKNFEKALVKGSIHAEFAIAMMIHRGQFYNQSYESAFQRFTKLHMENYYPATFALAVYLENGLATDINLEQAFEMYEIAAKHGKVTKAWRAMGNLYLRGTGVGQNIDEAIHCFKVAADGNDEESMYNLGILYSSGKNVSIDYEKAVVWFKKAALAGEPRSMYQLGRCFQLGQGVEQSEETALEYYLEAADSGYAFAKRLAAPILLKGDSSQVSHGIQMMQELADSGDVEIQFELGMHYLRGDIVSQNPGKALLLIEHSAAEEYSPALYTLGLLHYEQIIPHADREKGLAMIKKAAEARYELAIDYLNSANQ